MFKGSRTIGTRNIDRDLEIIEEQEELQERIRAVYRTRGSDIASEYSKTLSPRANDLLSSSSSKLASTRSSASSES